jgi:Asp-tRNA(Asn)/Glu-tRNA(Gln) amidotransferase A subunit family amidase
LKPTYGRVSRFGVLPLGFSLDHAGPLTRSVRDAALTLNAIAGHDPRDPGSSRRPVVDFEPDEDCSIRGVRIGFPEGFFFDHLHEDVESAVRGALARAGSLGAVIKPVWLPDMEALNAIARIVLLSEASAVLEPHMENRAQFGPDVLALLDQGRLVPATDYVNAQRLRRRMRREFDLVWREVDCLIAPATPSPAPRIGDTTIRLGGRDEDVRLATTRLVRGVNALGFPALSLPCGLSDSGLPVGLQIIGPAFEEALILRIGAALEDGGVGIPPCPLA